MKSRQRSRSPSSLLPSLPPFLNFPLPHIEEHEVEERQQDELRRIDLEVESYGLGDAGYSRLPMFLISNRKRIHYYTKAGGAKCSHLILSSLFASLLPFISYLLLL